ncbi:MAG TPA: SAM-dependent methyltransferase [Myxococcaceae bacterium]|jgi:predicted methyltransferase
MSSIDYAALVAAPDRAESDRSFDGQRKPAELLAFLGVKPGMKVGELVAGTGYTTELLARAVGPQGTVHAQNPAFILQLFAAKPWADRLARPGNACVVRADREIEEPFPPEIRDLDLMVSFGIYHDAAGVFRTDRARMNASVFAALKQGGHYAVLDSSARAGTGAADAGTLHRIDEQLVQREVEMAGFRLERSGDFLRNPADARDWDASPRAAGARRGTGDRFALMFLKP